MSLLTKLFNKTETQEIPSILEITKITFKELHAKLKAENKQLAILAKTIYHGSSTYQEARSKHIAYCMLRGRTFEQIESKWKDERSWINHTVKKMAFDLLAKYKIQIGE